MKKISKRFFGAMLATVMLISMVPVGVLNASAQSDYATGDIVEIGSFPQTKVTDAALISTLDSQILTADNTVTYSGSKYLKQTDWFKYEPIQWRVLSNTNGELFVLAEKILDSRAYNQDNSDVTWETCSLRSWLNNDFFNAAFTSTEQSKIETSTVINDDNPWYGTEGGNNTNDKLYLLSYAEAMNPAYGFNSSYSAYDTARRAQGSDYAKSHGLYVSTNSSYLGNSYWWLRTSGINQSDACNVYSDGYVNGNGYDVDGTTVGVRPAFKIHLISGIFTSKGNTDCTINGLSGFVYGLDPGISSLADYAETAPGYNTEYVPTPSGFGTGTAVNISKDGILAESYLLVIFGDVTGDGNINGIDAGKTIDVENYMVSWDAAADAAFLKAGDVNGDGNVNGLDAGIMVNVENYMMAVNQLTGIASAITPIDGSVSISGSVQYGNTLTADVSGVTPAGATMKYIWKHGAVVAGTGSSFTVAESDIGKALTLTVTGKWVYEGSIRSAAVTPTKADTAAPAAPVLVEKTSDSVTLAAAAGQEYKVNEGEWQASPIFSGLSPNTEYNFYTRVAETATHFASAASVSLSVTTFGLTVSGTVAISGLAKYGEVLTADISGVNVPSEFIACQWKRGEEVIGNENLYTVTAEDIGQPLTVSAIGTGGYEGSVTSTAVIPGKADAAAPAAPTLSSKTSSSVTLAAVAGQEFRVDEGEWQASPVFTGLAPNKAYSFYARLAETATALASPASTALSVTTDKAAISGTVVIIGSPSVGTTLTVDISGIAPPDATVSYRWKSDGTQVGTGSTYTIDGADVGTEITVTVTGTGDYTGSITSAATGVIV